MKKLIAIALILAFAVTAVACGSTESNKTNTPASEKTSAKSDVEKIVLLSGNELIADTFTVLYCLKKADGTLAEGGADVTATVKVVSANGVTVYDGEMTKKDSDGFTLDYAKVTPSASTKGTATVTVKTAGITETKDYELNKLPYDLSDIKLPTVGTKAKQYGSSGDYYGEATLRDATVELKYVNSDYVTLSVKLVFERTTAGDVSSKYVGAHVKAVDGSGAVRYNDNASSKIADDGKATVTLSIKHVPGTGLTVDVSDYK